MFYYKKVVKKLVLYKNKGVTRERDSSCLQLDLCYL